MKNPGLYNFFVTLITGNFGGSLPTNTKSKGRAHVSLDEESGKKWEILLLRKR